MTTGWNQGTGELDTPKQRLSFSEVPDRPCCRRNEAEVCYSGARNVGLETEMPQTDDSADELPEAGQVRTSRNRHRSESPRAADYYTAVCSISGARYRPNNRSKSRSRTFKTGIHAGPRGRKTAAEVDSNSSESEPVTICLLYTSPSPRD